MAPRNPLDLSLLEVRLLEPGDAAAAAAFTCGDAEPSPEDADLDDFLRSDALRLQEAHIVRTFVALYDEKLVGFISLMSDAIVLETKERKKLSLGREDHPVVPALKVARLGCDKAFREQYEGLGTVLMRFAYGQAIDINDFAACRLLTLDAYPQSVEFYEKKLRFVRNRAKEYREKNHPSMRLDVYDPDPPAWTLGVAGPSSESPESDEGPSTIRRAPAMPASAASGPPNSEDPSDA
jgi:hypothetical protein